jgi:hypothetical protein
VRVEAGEAGEPLRFRPLESAGNSIR